MGYPLKPGMLVAHCTETRGEIRKIHCVEIVQGGGAKRVRTDDGGTWYSAADGRRGGRGPYCDRRLLPLTKALYEKAIAQGDVCGLNLALGMVLPDDEPYPKPTQNYAERMCVCLSKQLNASGLYFEGGATALILAWANCLEGDWY